MFTHTFGIFADVDALDSGVAGGERKEASKHLDDSGFATAIGTEKSEDFAFFDAEADVVDCGEFTESANQMVGGDGGLDGVGHGSALRRELDVSSHASKNAMRRIVDSDFDAENLVDTFLASLDIARKKFGLLINLFHDAVENLIGK